MAKCINSKGGRCIPPIIDDDIHRLIWARAPLYLWRQERAETMEAVASVIDALCAPFPSIEGMGQVVAPLLLGLRLFTEEALDQVFEVLYDPDLSADGEWPGKARLVTVHRTDGYNVSVFSLIPYVEDRQVHIVRSVWRGSTTYAIEVDYRQRPSLVHKEGILSALRQGQERGVLGPIGAKVLCPDGDWTYPSDALHDKLGFDPGEACALYGVGAGRYDGGVRVTRDAGLIVEYLLR